MRHAIAVAVLLSTALLSSVAPAAPRAADPQLRRNVPARWWEKAAAIRRMTFKPGQGNLSLDATKAAAQLDELAAQGFSAVEIFAPYHGGNSYNGLDAIDRDRPNPEYGTMADFRRLVRMAHQRGLAVVAFDNLGYPSVDSPAWLDATEDVKAGRMSGKARWFLWSDREDAPAPPGDRVFMLPGQAGGWTFSERAGRYYWGKWKGVDLAGQPVARLPQYDWGSGAWQDEAQRVIRLWMDTGIDGMIIDAVNWYPNFTWGTGRRRITDVIARYGNAMIQPEGAGGFKDDPTAWITEGGWNCVQDYGLGKWWQRGNDLILKAIDAGDPRPLEEALRAYHDRVVAAGGTLYHSPPGLKDPEKLRLYVATIAVIGDMVLYEYDHRQPLPPDAETTWLFRTKAANPALHQTSTRRKLPTAADERQWAFLRLSADGKQKVVVALNYATGAATVEIDVSAVDARAFRDLRSGREIARENPLRVEVAGRGVTILEVR